MLSLSRWQLNLVEPAPLPSPAPTHPKGHHASQDLRNHPGWGGAAGSPPGPCAGWATGAIRALCEGLGAQPGPRGAVPLPCMCPAGWPGVISQGSGQGAARAAASHLPRPGAAFTCLETAFRLDALHRQMKLLGEDSPVSKLQVKLEPGIPTPTGPAPGPGHVILQGLLAQPRLTLAGRPCPHCGIPAEARSGAPQPATASHGL